MADSQEKGIIGEIVEDGFPVVFKLVDELPFEDTRGRFGWLTVVSWKYDGRKRNGMPPEGVNSRMISLEHAFETALEEQGYTGAGDARKCPSWSRLATFRPILET